MSVIQQGIQINGCIQQEILFNIRDPNIYKNVFTNNAEKQVYDY